MATETAATLTERPSTDGLHQQLFIDGEWEPAADGGTYEITDPGTGATIGAVARGGEQDAARAVAAARRAFDEGGWPLLTPRERGRILLAAAALMREHAEELAQLESLDVGKPITFSRIVDAPTAAETFEYYGSLAAGIEGAARPVGADTLSYTRREPYGVVAAITPFNFPMILSATKVAPALAAGNTVVHKPAEETPMSALRVAELLQEAGVPAGVYNLVTGGPEAGAALVRDRRVDMVAFTGSTAVGREVARLGGETLKRVMVELGGKSANIVFADADLEGAIQTAIQAVVFNTGQFCLAGSRLLIQRPIYDQVVAGISAALPHVPVGDPFAPDTVIGPMAGPKHVAKVNSFVDAAIAEGVEAVGRDRELPSEGQYVAPTLLPGVSPSASYVQQEIFGPVIAAMPFDTEEEAVALANSTDYGLAAGLQTADLRRAHRTAAALRAGIVWVNTWGRMDVAVPFGGYNQSGYGRENGPEGLDEYLHTKSIVVAL